MGTPNYPPDWGTVVKKLQNDVKAAYRSANRRLGQTIVGGDLSVQGGGNITVQDGGSFEAIGPDGMTVLVQISSAAGTATFQGQLISGPGGDQVIVNPTGTTVPEIRFLPGTSPTNYVRIRGLSTGDLLGTATPNEVVLQIASGINVANTNQAFIETHANYIYLTVNDASGTNTGAGGQVLLNTAGARLAYAGASTGAWTIDQNGIIYALGKWDNFVDRGATSGLFTGNVAGTASAASITLTYGATRASQVVPITEIRDGSVHSKAITANTTASFTMTMSPAAGGAWNCYFWCFRI